MTLPPNLRLALFALGLLIFHLIGSGAFPLVDRDEPRFAEASREMLERRDFVVPYFNNRERFDKPPLTYWCQAAAYLVLGETELAARLPSALAATLIALLLIRFGSALPGANGWRAALIFSLSLQTMMHARAAVADMLLVLFTTGAFLAGWELCRAATKDEKPGWRAWFIFWGCLGLGFLAKGPVALLPIGAVGILAFWVRPPNLARHLRWGLGSLLLLAIIASWGGPALLQTHGEFWKVGIGRHVVERSLRPLEGHGGKGLLGYLFTFPLPWLTVFLSLFPWSWHLPGLVRRLYRQPALDPSAKYLVGGVLLTFAIFTFSATKLPHYTLPAFPLLALLLDQHWPEIDAVPRFRRWTTVTATVMLAVSLFALPRLDFFFPSERLYRQAKPWLRPEMEFASFDYQEPSLVWTFRRIVRGFHSPLKDKQLPKFMEKPGARFCILPTEQVAQVFPTIDPRWQTTQASGFNIPKGRRVNLTLLVKPGER